METHLIFLLIAIIIIAGLIGYSVKLNKKQEDDILSRL